MFPSAWQPYNQRDVQFEILFFTSLFSSLFFPLPKQNYAAEVNCLVALHELYKYINKYYDQVSTRSMTAEVHLALVCIQKSLNSDKQYPREHTTICKTCQIVCLRSPDPIRFRRYALRLSVVMRLQMCLYFTQTDKASGL